MNVTDSIERRILLKAPRSRVWRSLSDAEEFGKWFGVEFRAERLLSWRWHPAAVDPKVDYSSEPMTLVVFELADTPAGEGTLLSVVESGLDQIPLSRRATVFRLNNPGWEQQMNNIQKHVATP